jgi:hypothetical protein
VEGFAGNPPARKRPHSGQLTARPAAGHLPGNDVAKDG